MGNWNKRVCPACERMFDASYDRCPDDQTDLVTLADLEAQLIGRTIAGRFTIESLVGRGGMGSVYRAVQHSVGRDVAVKVVRGQYAASATAVKRFVREARLASQIAHPNTVTIFDFGQTKDGLLFLVMEMLKGDSLRANLRKRGRFDVSRALGIAAQVADGLDAAHRLGIVHRDLKPGNIVLLDDNRGRDLVKILDFGLARTLTDDASVITQEGNLVGTIAYMAPETIGQGISDPRSDLYSLGIMLYELLTGTRPYVGESPAAILLQHVQTAAAPFSEELAIAKVVEQFVVRLIAKKPEDRFQTAAAVRERVLLLLDALGNIRVTHSFDVEPDTSMNHSWISISTLEEDDPSENAAVDLGDEPLWNQNETASCAPGALIGSSLGKSSSQSLLEPASTDTVVDPSAPQNTPTELAPTTLLGHQSRPVDPKRPESSPSPRARRTNLERRLDAFVGRTEELAALEHRLTKGTVRLVTLLGPGGTGKTRLAQRFAELYVDAFSGGAWFCDLAEVHELDHLLGSVGASLEIPLRDLEPIEQLGNAIAGRESVLMIFDNFEQVVEHGHTTVGAWLQQAPEARFLITSRRPLGLEGEHIIELAPMPENDAVALFIERATAQNPLFEWAEEHRSTVTEIVNRLDRMSLAIELAASRTRVLTVEQLLSRLDQRFRLLRSTRRDLPPRQATLQGAIDWSWDLLDPWEKLTLAQCSVFHDGFTLDAIESIARLDGWPKAPWPMDVVQSLGEHSLLRSLSPTANLRRFSMYESIREYAADKMATEGAVCGPDGASLTGPAAQQALRRRHAEFFARLGDVPAIEALNTRGGVVRRHHLALELKNVMAGLEWATVEGMGTCAAHNAIAASYVLEATGPFSAGLEVVERASNVVELPASEQIRLMERRGWFLALTGRIDEALDTQQSALAKAQDTGAKRQEGVLLSKVGDLHLKKGHLETALACHTSALAIQREMGDRRNEGVTLGCLGLLLQSQGRMAEALTQFESSLAIHHAVGNRRAEGMVLGNLGVFHMLQGRTDRGKNYYRRALAIHRETGNRRFEGVLLGNLGLQLAIEGRLGDASEHLEKALAIHRQVGNRRGEGVTLGNLADLFQKRGESTRSAEYLVRAIEICDVSFPAGAGSGRGRLALIRAQNGRLEDARALLERGEEQLRNVHALETGHLLCRRGEVERLAGEFDDARDALAEAESIADQMDAGEESSLGQAIARLREHLD